MNPKTCYVHTKEQSFMERWLLKMKDPHCTETWKYFSKVLSMTVVTWPYRTSILLAFPEGRGWWGNVMSTREIQKRSSLPPLPSFDYKNITHWELGKRKACLHPCEPYRGAILINHFLSITLSLAEFPSVLRYKGLWCHENYTKWFQVATTARPW